MGTPILSSLRDLLTLSGVAEADLPHPDRTPLSDAFKTVERLVSASPKFFNHGALDRAHKGLHYLHLLEQAYTMEAAADHPRRGMA
jgi:ferredoxin-NADP reductase